MFVFIMVLLQILYKIRVINYQEINNHGNSYQ